jgi:hypothetical protein
MPSFSKPIKLSLIAVAAVLSTLALGVAPAAAAKTPCWKTLFLDYSDGRIDKTYPVHCYREAIKHLGEDQLVYGSAADDIQRALQAAIATMKHPGGGGGPPDANASVEPQGGGKSAKHHRGLFGWLADRLGPGGADSIPLPLLVFAILGLLLIAAAGASFFARRIQARRTQPAGVPTRQPQPRK